MKIGDRFVVGEKGLGYHKFYVGKKATLKAIEPCVLEFDEKIHDTSHTVFKSGHYYVTAKGEIEKVCEKIEHSTDTLWQRLIRRFFIELKR